MSGFTAAGINKDTVTTTQQAPLGFELTVATANKGNQVWIYVKSAAADLLHGDVCMINGDATPYEVKESTGQVAQKYVGVAQHFIANGSYGFILKSGPADYVFTGGAVAGGHFLMTAADGKGTTATIGTAGHIASIIGYAEADDGDTTVGGTTRSTCPAILRR